VIQSQTWYPAEMEGITLDAIGGMKIAWTTDAEACQAVVFLEALKVYAERKYNDNWVRFGWRGCLFRLRERVERLWDNLWDATPPPTDFTKWCGENLDDAIDMINFAAFFVRAVRENNRDGSWWTGP
jgi:hypothetical protein